METPMMDLLRTADGVLLCLLTGTFIGAIIVGIVSYFEQRRKGERQWKL